MCFTSIILWKAVSIVDSLNVAVHKVGKRQNVETSDLVTYYMSYVEAVAYRPIISIYRN